MKDFWDKAEVVAKFLGAVVIPIAVAVVAWKWNTENTRTQTSAQMIQIAIGVLGASKDAENSDQSLRKWAVAVMQNPSNPPRLDDESAKDLLLFGLPDISWGLLKPMPAPAGKLGDDLRFMDRLGPTDP